MMLTYLLLLIFCIYTILALVVFKTLIMGCVNMVWYMYVFELKFKATHLSNVGRKWFWVTIASMSTKYVSQHKGYLNGENIE